MTGLDDEDNGPERMRPVPHPDDRLWRHPAEMAALLAAQADASANAPHSEPNDPQADITTELPRVAPTPTATGFADAQSRARSHRVHRGLVAASVAVVAGATALTVGAFSASVEINHATPDTRELVTAPRDTLQPANGMIAVSNPVRAAQPGSRLTEDTAAPWLYDRLADSLPRIQAASATGMVEGSGLFVTADGHIATSAKLVVDSDYVLAWTHDGRRLPAHVVAVDRFSDVAILVVDALSLPVSLLTDEASWSGGHAMVINYESHSMELDEIASLVSARAVNELGDASSRVRISNTALPGSAIVDAAGSVVAMVNLGAGQSDSHATPAWMLDRVVRELLDHGVAMHPWLGLQVTQEPDAMHVRVTQVVPGSPAEHSGLRIDDLIDSIDGEPLGPTRSLWTIVQQRKPGDRVSLAVTRNGNRRLISAHLEALVN